MPDVLKLLQNYLLRTKKLLPIEPGDAYEMWSATYDEQDGNLMLDLDELIFTKLLNQAAIEGKAVYDVGCGTGRHWKKIFEKRPASLTGFDISSGMLLKLKAKFPNAIVKEVGNKGLAGEKDASCDVLISTLTIAHILNVDDALNNWCRVMKPSAEMIITDFHPDSLSLGAQRTFRYNNEIKAVNNNIHTVETIKRCLFENGFRLVNEEYRKVDETVKEYYEAKKALEVYKQFFGVPIIYGLHFQR